MPLHWRNPSLPFRPYEWTPVHHHGVEPTPTSCHPHSIQQIPFQECWSVSVIHRLPDSTPEHIRRQFETTYHFILQSRHTPHSQHPLTPPNSTLAPVALNSFDSVSSILLLRKVTVIWPKVYIFVSSLYVLTMLTLGSDDALICLM